MTDTKKLTVLVESADLLDEAETFAIEVPNEPPAGSVVFDKQNRPWQSASEIDYRRRDRRVVWMRPFGTQKVEWASLIARVGPLRLVYVPAETEDDL